MICSVTKHSNELWQVLDSVSFRSDGPLVVILFAGEGVYAAAYFSEKIQRDEFIKRFSHWKASFSQR